MLLLYIDPGTGSMLFTVLIGLISAGIYALRGALIKLRFILGGGSSKDVEEGSAAYVMFTESKTYWNVFEPVCDEFEARGIRARYLTASADDPALEKRYEHVSCEFIGDGNKAFAKMNMLKADIVLSSTPGLNVYQWKRSRDVRWYVHIFHAISDPAMYRMFGIDHYDAVMLTGEWQKKQIRDLERAHKRGKKELPLVGITYFDRIDKQLAQYSPADNEKEHPTTVLLAPSWGKSSIFSLYGGDIIEALLDTGYHIIVRPHPQSFKSEAELMDKLMSDYPASEQLEWNRDNDNLCALQRADIMISDFSGVIFDFAFVFDKPIIYTEPSYDKAPYDACWLDEELWTFQALSKIGRQLSSDSIGEIKSLIDSCINDEALKKSRDETRDECWVNRGESARYAVDYLVAKHEELKQQQ